MARVTRDKRHVAKGGWVVYLEPVLELGGDVGRLHVRQRARLHNLGTHRTKQGRKWREKKSESERGNILCLETWCESAMGEEAAGGKERKGWKIRGRT